MGHSSASQTMETKKGTQYLGALAGESKICDLMCASVREINCVGHVDNVLPIAGIFCFLF